MSEKSTNQRIGIFGGTFDPIHLGHLLIAETAREQLGLHQVRFIPAAIAPHKLDRTAAVTGKQRAEMVQLAINGNPAFVCDQRELSRGGVSYTVDTLEELRREYTASQLVLIIGADSLHELDTWREPQRICELAFVAVVARGGQPTPDLTYLQRYLPPAQVADDEKNTLEQHLISMPQLEISSTDIRRRIASGYSVRYLLPPAVAAYIAAQQLYRGSVANSVDDTASVS